MTEEELTIKYQEKSFGAINVERDFDDLWDDNYNVVDKGWSFYLNHSCDNWVIGDLDSAKKFKKNLVQAIKYTESNP